MSWYLIGVERETGKREELSDMMTEISARTVRTGSYETDYEDIYEADHDITTAEADNLIAVKYRNRMFPIIRASYTVIIFAILLMIFGYYIMFVIEKTMFLL